MRRERHGRAQRSRQQQYVAGKGANLLPQESSDLLAYPAEKRTRIFIFLSSPLIFLPPYFTFSHLFCSVLFYSVKNSTPTIANSSLLGDVLALGSCLPKDRGITSLKTSYFAILKAASLSLSQKPIIQSSLSVLSPYANLMGSCLQSKRDCPLYHSMPVWVHMCNHAGGVCVCTQGSRVSMK